MPQRYTITRSFRSLIDGRLRALPAYLRGRSERAHVEDVGSTIVPVVVVGEDASDDERPIWGITTLIGAFLGQVSTISLTNIGGRDVEVHELVWLQIPQVIGATELHVLTPPASWVPFANNFARIAPGIRPRLDFSIGSTEIWRGSNALGPPFSGLRLAPQFTYDYSAPNYHGRLRWEPPLILPGGMFLTATTNTLNTGLSASFVYRELG